MLEICKRCAFNQSAPCTSLKSAEKDGYCLLYEHKDEYDGFGPSMAGLTDW